MSEKNFTLGRRTLRILAHFGMTKCESCGTPLMEGMKVSRKGRGRVYCESCAERILINVQPIVVLASGNLELKASTGVNPRE